MCSAAIAGRTISALAAARPDADVVVVFGAVHRPAPLDVAVFDSHEFWQTPSGLSRVFAPLRDELVSDGRLFAVDDAFHTFEHAVEVELPLVQAAWPDAEILPVEVPVIDTAVDVGVRTARAAKAAGLNARLPRQQRPHALRPGVPFHPRRRGVTGPDIGRRKTTAGCWRS